MLGLQVSFHNVKHPLESILGRRWFECLTGILRFTIDFIYITEEVGVLVPEARIFRLDEDIV